MLMIPTHIAIIPDGNRRYGKKYNMPLHVAYGRGMKKVEEVLEWSREMGIKFVTIWGFSTENLGRSPAEKKIFFKLMESRLNDIVKATSKKSINARIKIIGRRDLLPESLKRIFSDVEKKTEKNNGIQLNFAVGYGGRQEIVDACNRLMETRKATGEITMGEFQNYLYTTGMPDPELVIRTSGESRLSGFMPWQAVYSELIFLKPLWPELGKKEFMGAVKKFESRNRRFGK